MSAGFLAALFILLSGAESGAQDIQLFAEPVDGNILVWPGYKRQFHSIAGSPCNLTFKIVTSHNSAKPFRNARLSVLVPSEVKVEEILPQYTLKNGCRTEFSLPIRKRQTGGGMQYVCELDDFLAINRSVSYCSKKEISFFFEPAAFQPDREYPISYSLECGGTRIAGDSFALKFLPPIRQTRMPGHVTLLNFVQLWHLNVRSPELLRKISLKYRNSGLDSRALDSRNLPHNFSVENRLREMGWRMHCQYFYSPLRYPRSLAKGIEIKPGEMHDGRKSMKHHCPTAAFRNQKLLEKVCAFDTLSIQDGDLLILDSEPFGYWNDACFCSECLDAFAKEFKLDRKTLTSPDAVRTKCGKQWLRHLCMVQAKADGLVVESYRKKFPRSKVAAYNYFYSFSNPEKLFTELKGCPQDPRDYDALLDCHLVSAYSANGKMYVERMKEQRRHLRKPLGVTLSLDRGIGEGSGYLPQSETVSPRENRLKILTAASLGGTMILHYAGIYYDGMIFTEAARAMGEIAVYEDFFRKGEQEPPVSVRVNSAWNRKQEDEWLDGSLAFTARSLNRDLLITLMNYHRTIPILAEVMYSGPLENFYVSDRAGKTLYTFNGRERWNKAEFLRYFKVTVPAEDAKFVLISEAKPALNGLRKQEIRGTAAAGNREKTETQSAGEIAAAAERYQKILEQPAKSREWHNSVITVEKDAVRIRTLSQSVVLSLDSGLIIEWKNAGGAEILSARSPSAGWDFGSGGAWTLVYSPEILAQHFRGSHLRFVPVENTITDEGTAVVRLGTLQKRFYMEKTFTFDAASPAIQVKTSLRNLSGEMIRCAQWFRMCYPVNNMRFTSGGEKLNLLKNNNFFGPDFKTSGARTPAEYKGKLPGNDLTGYYSDGSSVSLRFPPSVIQSANLYLGKTRTAEVITKTRLLKPLKTFSYAVTLVCQARNEK